MKRRDFLKLSGAALTAAALPAVPALAKPKDNITVRKGLPPAYFKTMAAIQIEDSELLKSSPVIKSFDPAKQPPEDNTSIWNANWDNGEKIHIFGESSSETYGDWQGIGDRYK